MFYSQAGKVVKTDLSYRIKIVKSLRDSSHALVVTHDSRMVILEIKDCSFEERWSHRLDAEITAVYSTGNYIICGLLGSDTSCIEVWSNNTSSSLVKFATLDLGTLTSLDIPGGFI